MEILQKGMIRKKKKVKKKINKLLQKVVKKQKKKFFFLKNSKEKNTDLCKPLLMARMALPVLKQNTKRTT